MTVWLRVMEKSPGRCLVRTCDAAAAADSGRLLRHQLRTFRLELQRTSRDKVFGRREER